MTSAGPRTALPDLLTTSAAKAYRACPRMYRLAYEELVRPAHVDPNRTFGTLGHHGLEAWWKAAGEPVTARVWTDLPETDAIIECALNAVRKHHAEMMDADRFDLVKAEALMIGYHARWIDEVHGDARRFDVIAVEVQFEGPLVNPETNAASKTWRAGGKIDAIVRERATGRIYLIEHKTSAEDISLGSEYWERLTLDPQVSNYLAGARWLSAKLGFDPKDVAGVIYDVIAKPAQRPLQATPVEARKFTKPTKADPIPRLYANQRDRDETTDEYFERIANVIAEAPDKFYARGEIVRLEADVREAAQDLWQVGVQIRDARRLKLFPRNPDACRRYGRSCDYLPVCLGVASLDDESRYRRAPRAHEELAPTAPQPAAS